MSTTTERTMMRRRSIRTKRFMTMMSGWLLANGVGRNMAAAASSYSPLSSMTATTTKTNTAATTSWRDVTVFHERKPNTVVKGTKISIDRRLQNNKDNQNKEDKNATPAPSASPSANPTRAPTPAPTPVPTTPAPTGFPSSSPTSQPSTPAPTQTPSASPTRSPSPSTSRRPTTSPAPSSQPSPSPSSSQSPTTTNPSGSPSFSPTMPPSKSPSVSPTNTPSASPTTGMPSSFPTPAPSETGLNGIINLRFSVLRDGLDALDFVLGREELLVLAVKQSINRILCADTDLDVWTSRDGDSLCYTFTENNNNTTRHLQQQVTGRVKANYEGALRDDLAITVVDNGRTARFNYTEWRVAYPVNRVGALYNQMAAENDGTAIDMIESVAQLALDVRIDSGDVDDWLQEQHKAPRLAVVGKEDQTWNEDNPTAPPLTVEELPESIVPAPLHGLRIAGFIMLVLSVGFWLLLIHMSGVRKKEREWDEEFRERGRGGLGTEEGLDYMLEVGRNNNNNDGDAAAVLREGTLNGTNGGSDKAKDDDLKVPLPGYLDYR